MESICFTKEFQEKSHKLFVSSFAKQFLFYIYDHDDEFVSFQNKNQLTYFSSFFIAKD